LKFNLNIGTALIYMLYYRLRFAWREAPRKPAWFTNTCGFYKQE